MSTLQSAAAQGIDTCSGAESFTREVQHLLAKQAMMVPVVSPEGACSAASLPVAQRSSHPENRHLTGNSMAEADLKSAMLGASEIWPM